jgi:hypothetical protein
MDSLIFTVNNLVISLQEEVAHSRATVHEFGRVTDGSTVSVINVRALYEDRLQRDRDTCLFTERKYSILCMDNLGWGLRGKHFRSADIPAIRRRLPLPLRIGAALPPRRACAFLRLCDSDLPDGLHQQDAVLDVLVHVRRPSVEFRAVMNST